MKAILTISIIVLLVLACIVTASGPAEKRLCPICKKEINSGDYVVDVYVNGSFQKVHFKHAFDKAWEDRFVSLREK